MSWARIDDGFHDHPKVDELSLAAVGLWTLSLTWAHRHRKTAVVPGHITDARVRKLAGKQADTLTAELVAARLWDVEPNLGGWLIHDFADYLPRERDPDERREAGRKGGLARQGKPREPSTNLPDDTKEAGSNTEAESQGKSSSRASAPAFPTRPVPDPKNENQDLGGQRPETLRASDATAHPPHQPPTTGAEPPADARCTKHRGVRDPSPCAGCRAARELAEKRADRAADQAGRANEAAARACTRCDGVWIVDPKTALPTRRKCDHRRTA